MYAFSDAQPHGQCNQFMVFASDLRFILQEQEGPVVHPFAQQILSKSFGMGEMAGGGQQAAFFRSGELQCHVICIQVQLWTYTKKMTDSLTLFHDVAQPTCSKGSSSQQTWGW